MGKYIKNIRDIFLLIFLFLFPLHFCSANINDARELFLKGEYIKAIKLCKKIDTLESQILQSRIISIHSYFFKEGKPAELAYLEAYEIAKKIIKNNDKLAEAHVELAHALGRYGQEIGIMSAISKGIADEVKHHLLLALKLDEDNVIASLSLGVWHSEITNKAGKVLANLVYGAKAERARFFLRKALKINNDQIGVLFEVARGFLLLESQEDIKFSKKLLIKLLSMKNFSHMDSLYKIKARKILENI